MSVERQTGKTPFDLIEPEYPTASDYLLQTFYHLSSGRQQGMNGPLPIPWTEFESYMKLMNESLEPWEISILRELDTCFIEAVHEYSKE